MPRGRNPHSTGAALGLPRAMCHRGAGKGVAGAKASVGNLQEAPRAPLCTPLRSVFRSSCDHRSPPLLEKEDGKATPLQGKARGVAAVPRPRRCGAVRAGLGLRGRGSPQARERKTATLGGGPRHVRPALAQGANSLEASASAPGCAAGVGAPLPGVGGRRPPDERGGALRPFTFCSIINNIQSDKVVQIHF